ncbi:gas vesicle protein GvpO [Pseudonocardia sp.]|uniref:gas vesicle protein GvpO n=1 Tax=Pseudonocardia sp. TaxID=60912 RepID=UPI00261768B9|nr:gas vesicle protein GvpO [Pseudonocardia sp.]
MRRHRRESLPAGVAARRAAVEVAELTGHQPEAVISLERSDGEWKVGVEVVETHRIPDSADILAIYEVCLSSEGELISYRRTRRYARGQLLGEGR